MKFFKKIWDKFEAWVMEGVTITEIKTEYADEVYIDGVLYGKD